MNANMTTAARRSAPWTIWGVTPGRVAVVAQALVTSAASMVPSTTWERGRERFVRWLREFEKARAQRALEQQLAHIINIANGHRAKGLPKGSPAYVALHRQALADIEAFCAAHSLEQLAVQQQVPALRDLEALTQVPPPTARVIRGLAVILLPLIGATGVGCLAGLVAVGYHWVVALLAH